MSMLRRSASVLILAAIWALLFVPQASAQQRCDEIDAVILQCAPDRMITGDPPNCACDGVPVDPPLELTCERNFGCPGPTEIATGEWPECGCVVPETEPPTGGGSGGGGMEGPGPGVSLGGVDTCEMFFECPSGAEMTVEGGRCSCTLVMLPQSKE